jgi:signal transduction histidine kinase
MSAVMRRLYLQIYLAFLGMALLFGLLVAAAWWLTAPDAREHPMLEGITALVGDALRGPERPRAELAKQLRELAERFSADVAVWGPDGALIAASGEPPPAPSPRRRAGGWARGPGGPFLSFKLDDGRWVVARFKHRPPRVGFLAALGLLAVVAALGAYPVARRIAGRLERLQARVEALGAGDLAARVEVDGNDEVTRLARSFNQAADRIERLVGAQKSLLASVSHELRTPLARMRVALELLPEEARPELRARIERDIGELDGLIGELLLASRLDALDQPLDAEPLDLLALLAEEAAHTGAEVSGESVTLRGDARLLRRLIRNLLENARRYGGDAAVEASVQRQPGGGARLAIADRGPGVPESERERIFEPFHRLPSGSPGRDGVGLGLALVRQIARRHGGDARCLPRAGGGSVFEIDLSSGATG